MVSIAKERGESLLVQPMDLINRISANEALTVVDVRNPKPWDGSDMKIADAIRIDPVQLPIDPAWPKDNLLVFY